MNCIVNLVSEKDNKYLKIILVMGIYWFTVYKFVY